MGRVYGYVRISSRDQNEARQMAAMREAGVSDRDIYLDKRSGADFERQGYRQLLRRLRAGDTLIVKSIDRLGRNYDEILEQWDHYAGKVRVHPCAGYAAAGYPAEP